MKKILMLSLLCLVLAVSLLIRAATAAPRAAVALRPTIPAAGTATPAVKVTASPTPTLSATPPFENISLSQGAVPNFDHIVLIVLENEYAQNVVGTSLMPNFNALAARNVLLSNYSAIAHPSLPNYLALVSGSIQNITNDCTNCSVKAPNLTDEIEASGRNWKAYFEGMPSPCFVGSRKPYEQVFNPFIYFDSIQSDPVRCKYSLVPLTHLDADLKTGDLPNFMYIAPNVCHSGHDCSASVADAWLGGMVARLQGAPALQANSLIIVTFDEGLQQPTAVPTHGEVATLLISPLVQRGYVDPTAYTHYSLLKTIQAAWQLPPLGETERAAVNIISNPWIDQVGLVYPQELTVTP